MFQVQATEWSDNGDKKAGGDAPGKAQQVERKSKSKEHERSIASERSL